MAMEQTTPGAVALVGAGEYTDAMNMTDAWLLQTLGGPTVARVALLPTASGLEANSPTMWNEMGQRHFAALGVQDIRSTWILNRDGASDPKQLDLLSGANFFYLSGGNPQHTIDSLRDTPAWEIMRAAYAQGAVLAGCSAGAMAMSGYTISLRQVMAGVITGGPQDWAPALGIVPRVVVFPHFDRMPRMLSQPTLQRLIKGAPAGRVMLGVDERTALVRITLPQQDGAEGEAGQARWRVMGEQTVSVFTSNAEAQVLRVGDELTL
ncbi:MAG: Type 1 glutamine amidotransferase-like domain-containing protein [Ktedonobacterales bacterium]